MFDEIFYVFLISCLSGVVGFSLFPKNHFFGLWILIQFAILFYVLNISVLWMGIGLFMLIFFLLIPIHIHAQPRFTSVFSCFTGSAFLATSFAFRNFTHDPINIPSVEISVIYNWEGALLMALLMFLTVLFLLASHYTLPR